MKPLTSKQMQRLEKKKKKIAAFLEIAKLNDKDREAKAAAHYAREENESSNVSESNDAVMHKEEPSRKRHKKDSGSHEILFPEPERIVSKESQPTISNEIQSSVNDVPSESINYNNKKLSPSSKEFLDLKRELRERKNRLKCIPRFRLKEMGDNASIEADENKRTPLFLSDIQHLLMFSTMGNHSPYEPFRWCNLEKSNHISHTVVLVIEGVSLYDFHSHESMFTNINNNFRAKVEVITPVSYNGNIAYELSAVPVTKAQKKSLIERYGSLEVAMRYQRDMFKMLRAVFPVVESPASPAILQPTTDRFPRTFLLLSASQLIEENYPIPLKGELRTRYSDFVPTKDVYQEVTPSSPIFALDCEMCRTTTGELELTRVSIVNEKLQVVYDSLVKPYNRITNYLTQYSGITKELLKDVTVRLEDVQKDIRNLLPPDAILVGQSLNFDLVALKMMHPYIIDTSVIYNITGDRRRKTKLSHLSQKFLGEEIQQSHQGHCSVEDSTSSLKLTLLKLANDLEFGDSILTRCRTFQEKQKSATSSEQSEFARSLFVHVTSTEKSAAIVGNKEIINQYTEYLSGSLFSTREESETKNKIVHCKVTSNEMVVAETCNMAKRHGLTLAHLQVDKTESRTETMKQVNEWCGLIWDQVAYKGMCLIMFGGERSGSNGACFIQIKNPPVA